MKTYSFKFEGVYFTGRGVVVAETIEEAINLAKEKVKDINLIPNYIEDVEVILPGTCVVLNEGKY